MTMSLYSWPLWLTGFGVACFGLVVILKNPSQLLSWLFAGCALSVSWWSFGYGLLYSASTPESALQFARWGYMGVVFIPSFFCHFVVEFLQIKRRWPLIINYLASLAFLCVTQSDAFLSDIFKYFWGFYPKAGPLYGLFIAFFYVGFGSCVVMLIRAFIQMRGQRGQMLKYNQVKYVLVALCVASASFSDYLPNYGHEVYPFAYLAAAGWLVIMAYGTLRYRVMDINVIIRKTLIYASVTGCLTAIYLGAIAAITQVFGGLTGYQTALSSGLAAALIAFGFQPLKRRVQDFVDRKFFRQYVDREEKLYELSRDVVTHATPEDMAKGLLRVIGETLHPKVTALYLRARHQSGFARMAWAGEGEPPELMPEDNPLAGYFADHPQPFILESDEEHGRSQSTRRAAAGERSERDA